MTYLHLSEIIENEFIKFKEEQKKNGVIILLIFRQFTNRLMAETIPINIPSSGRKQIKFVRKLKPLKWK